MGKRLTSPRPFFHFEELKSFDKISIGVYAIATIVFWFLFKSGGLETKKGIIIAYAVIPQLCLYFFLYVSLRNFKVYLIWLFFGFVHLTIYFSFKKNENLTMYRGNPLSIFTATIILLLLFQLLRFLSLKIQHREFVAPAKGGGKDLIENKDISATDYLILVIYMGTWLALALILP
jgi:uncharacterized membrane protein